MKGLPGYRSALRGETIPDAGSPYTDEATQGDAVYLWWLVARRYASVRDFTDGDHRDRRIAITENDRWRSR